MPIEPVRFEDVGECHFVGLRRTLKMDTAGEEIAAMWAAFSAAGPVEGQNSEYAYGIMPKDQPAEGSFDYMPAVGVSAFTEAHSGRDQLTIPAARYAVFWHGEHAMTAKTTWSAIFGEWQPQSGFDHDATPFLEVYDQRFDPATGEGGFEIWIPVKAKE
ncbi:MAG: GyrI-like domain-containing protein [Pseudomonadota bacterium]